MREENLYFEYLHRIVSVYTESIYITSCDIILYSSHNPDIIQCFHYLPLILSDDIITSYYYTDANSDANRWINQLF